SRTPRRTSRPSSSRRTPSRAPARKRRGRSGRPSSRRWARARSPSSTTIARSPGSPWKACNSRMPEHTVTVRVRYGETDQMGVVYHPNYFLYFEAGRTELLRSTGVVYSELEKSGVFLVVTEASCTYRAAARYDEELRVITNVDHVGKATIGF